MARPSRDHFEQELRALQQDILGLSQKLAIPLPPSIHAQNASFGTGSHSQLLDKDALNGSVSYNEQRRPASATSATSAGTKDGQLARLRKQLHEVTRDRDDLAFKLKQVEKENEHLGKALRELSGMKASYETLKEDYEGVKLSLESSERIRRQQKELISMLRQSQASTDRGPQTSFISQRSEPFAGLNTSGLGAASINSTHKKDVSFVSESALSSRRNEPVRDFALFAAPHTASQSFTTSREPRTTRTKKTKRSNPGAAKSTKAALGSGYQPTSRPSTASTSRSSKPKQQQQQRAETSRVSMVRRTGKPPTHPSKKGGAAQAKPSSSQSARREHATNASFRSIRPASASSVLLNTSFATTRSAGHVLSVGSLHREPINLASTFRRFSR